MLRVLLLFCLALAAAAMARDAVPGGIDGASSDD